MAGTGLGVQPVGVAGGFLGPGPFLQHIGRDAAQFGNFLGCAGVASQFQAMAIGVKEVN